MRLVPDDDEARVIRQAWVQVLQSAYYRPIDISIGVTGQAPVATDAAIAL